MSRSIDHHLSLMSLMTIQLFVIEFDQNEGKSWYPFSVHNMKSSHSMSRWTITSIEHVLHLKHIESDCKRKSNKNGFLKFSCLPFDVAWSPFSLLFSCCCCCLRPLTRLVMEKKAALALLGTVLPFEAEDTLVGGDIFAGGVAGCLGKTIPPPAEKMGLAGWDKSITLLLLKQSLKNVNPFFGTAW